MDQEFVEILVFEVAGQRHALPAVQVQELLPAQSVMPVPGIATAVEGVINLRGLIVPVLDIRKCFGLPARALALSDHFIVIRAENRVLALHVDRALDLVRLDADSLTALDSLGAGKQGTPQVVKLGDGLVLLHHADDLVSAVDSRVWIGSSTATESIPREAQPS